METLYVVEPMDPVDTAILERWVRGHGGTAGDIVELPDPAAATCVGQRAARAIAGGG